MRIVHETLPSGVRIAFRLSEPDALQFAGQPLGDYLEAVGQLWVLRLRDLVDQLDLSSLLANYSPLGRAALHPRRLLGLVVYGMLLRQWSLRELEALARRDLGAVWLSGGLQPDHSCLADFFTRHTDTFTEAFFLDVTRHLVSVLHLEPVLAAGDGSVVEAASSRFRALRAQALEAARAKAAATTAESPLHPTAPQQLAELTAAAPVAKERTETRQQKDAAASDAAVVPQEPEAVVQPRKDGVLRPSYKPSLNVHPSRLIVGQHVEASSETAAIVPLLIQHRVLFDARPATQLLDAGYFTLEVLGLFLQLDVDLLCPGGKAKGTKDWAKASPQERYGKEAFVYDEERNVYVCPVGRWLRPKGRDRDRHGQGFQLYQTKECGGCRERKRCTESKEGRKVRRYAGEEVKEAMGEVLKQPRARAVYRKRQGMVEPVWSALRDRQGLVRFHRRGLKRVRGEFGLHSVAYNLRRAVQLQAIAGVLRLGLRTPHGVRHVWLLLVWPGVRRTTE